MRSLTATEPQWLRAFHRGPADAPVLVCLPHAGGSASAYFELSRRLHPAVEVLAVQYPGRQDRHTEPSITGMADLAERLAEAVGPITERQRPYALFGHSMGAAAAYELLLRLERDGRPAPLRLFASGRRAPSRTRAEDFHRRPDAELVDHVVSLGGITRAELRDPDVYAMVLPVLRADYTLIETYRAQPGRAVHSPVTVLTGDRDALVSPQEAAAWADHTAAGFELRTFPGGHFYLADHLPALAGLITGRLRARAQEGGRMPDEQVATQAVTTRIKDFIKTNFLDGDPDGELQDTSPLLEWGVLNSLNTVHLVGFLRSELGVAVPPVQVNGLNFKDVRSIAAMVLALRT